MLGTRKPASCSAALVALVLVASGCDFPSPIDLGPHPGDLEVTTVTGGANIDPDGYQLQVTRLGFADRARDIGSNDTVTFVAISDGRAIYTVTLNDIATNCSVDANPKEVTVPADGTGTVTFNITCA